MKGAKQSGKGIMCLGSGVEFLISAGSGEQRQDSVEARRRQRCFDPGHRPLRYSNNPTELIRTKVVLMGLKELG